MSSLLWWMVRCDQRLSALWWSVSFTHMVWWCRQIEAFSALLAFMRGIHRLQMPVTRSFDVFFDFRLNIRLNQRSRRRWFETPSRLSRRYCNGFSGFDELPDFYRENMIAKIIYGNLTEWGEIYLCLSDEKIVVNITIFSGCVIKGARTLKYVLKQTHKH